MEKSALFWKLMACLGLCAGFMAISLWLRHSYPLIQFGMHTSETGFQRDPDSLRIDSLYNYRKNGKSFKLTLLEFGSTHCRDCILMHEVLDQVKQRYSGEINTVFCNVGLKENKQVIRYFGVLVIPVQILLDSEGKECFRHTGFISVNQLADEFYKQGLKRK